MLRYSAWRFDECYGVISPPPSVRVQGPSELVDLIRMLDVGGLLGAEPIILGSATVGSAFYVRIFDKRLSEEFKIDSADCLCETILGTA